MLLVEDNNDLAEMIVDRFRADGHAMDHAGAWGCHAGFGPDRAFGN